MILTTTSILNIQTKRRTACRLDDDKNWLTIFMILGDINDRKKARQISNDNVNRSAFSLSWFPYAIVCLWSILQSSEDIIPVGLAVIPAVIAKVSVVWNPLIYIARTEQFRCAMVDTFPCLRVVSNIVWDNNNFAIEDIEIPANNENRMTVVKYSNQFSLGNDILEFKLEQPGPPKVEVKGKNQNDLKSPNCSQNQWRHVILLSIKYFSRTK
ncbi:RRH [Mytilus edulis]|uniref:RRH n=1 Tax=Mytilus edulis TaxID=6550 RepID=A0A8S3TE36_MYTED|nr:RRH [Mytilus edulis]